MKTLITSAVCAAALVASAACGGGDRGTTATGGGAANRASATPATQTTLAHGPTGQSGAVPPVASGHSTAAASPPAAGAQAPAGAAVDTSALDARIAQALSKAKAPNASAADKRAAADAYMERGNVFWNAGVPALYRRALADFNSVLLYQPGNADAQAKKAEIIRIYQSMNRPVPDYSNEQ